MSLGNHPSSITPLRKTWHQLMRSSRSHAPQLRSSLLTLVVAATLQGMALACMIPIMQAMLPVPHPGTAAGWLLGMTCLGVTSLAARWWAQRFDYGGDMVETTYELRTALGEQLRRVPLLQLQDRRSGEVHATLLGSVDEHLSYLLTIATMITHALIPPVVVALAALCYDLRIGLMMLLVFPLLIPLYRWRRPAFSRGMRVLAEAQQKTSADILEYTQGLPVLRSAGCTADKAQALQASIRHLDTVQSQGQKRGAGPNLVLTTIMELSVLLVMVIGSYWATRNSLQVSILAALMISMARFGEPLANFVLYAKAIEMVEAALEKIENLLDIRPLPQMAYRPPPCHHDIHFDHVTFSYPGRDTPILDGLAAKLPEHSLTALVGPSGAGKTTIIRLLMRQADPQSGLIRIGGVDIRAMRPEHLNALVSIVFQDVYLFDDSILANIRMAKPEATDAEVHAASRAAHCHDFVMHLPEGYQTRVGAIGSCLSAGERQRISIARAILKNAPIMILDEPTAALDAENEVAVQTAIDHLIRKRTVIMIAHRLSTLVAADQILVIDHGRVVESGSHAVLKSYGGRYTRMWQAQQATKDWHPGTGSHLHTDTS